MKRKFYDDPPEIILSNPDHWADNRDYWKEINYIASKYGYDVKDFRIDDITFGGEPVVFVAGKYWGYLMDDFYLEMEHGLDMYGDEYLSRLEEYKNNS